MMTEDYGEIAAALAKAQAAFPSITRDKTVTVRTKTGGEYRFAYAPLDSILSAVRKPLADNGLALVQLLDGDALVTLLLHGSGQSISGRTPTPQIGEIQAFGSAITYLRRYAIQALLGIAAEEDDDGNRAAGNTAKTVEAKLEHEDGGGLIGTVEVGDRSTSDYSLRQTPDGFVLGFRLRGERGGILVETHGALAEQLDAFRDATIGSRVTCWGTISDREFTPAGKKQPIRYQVLAADRVSVPGVGVLPVDPTPTENEPPGPSSGLSEADSEAIWSALDVETPA